jgi:hypothetical protein
MTYLFTDDQIEIYFNIDKKCYLVQVEGSFHHFGNNLIYLPNDSEAFIHAQQKLDSLQHLGEEYANVYFTYIPAKEFEYYDKSTHSVEYVSQKLIPQPYIKLSKEYINNSEPCFVSGRRSAIMKDNGRMIRLKGCGNEYIGFNLAEVVDIGPEHKEIRGSQFKNSCLREQYMTHFVNKLLQEKGLICGNVPIGFYKYSNEYNKDFSTLKNEALLIDKYCGLFYTNGEKRLGCDLFNAINTILRRLLSEDSYLDYLFKHIFIFENFAKELPNKNFKQHDDYIEIFFNDKIYNNDEYTNDLVFNLNDNLIFRDIQLEEVILKDFNLKTLYRDLKDKKMGIFNLLVMMLSKISYEAGYIKRLFEDNKINWGTYDYHCNAHLDNFIILPPNDKKALLAPVDFDLSFTAEQFIDIKYNNSNGIENKVTFENLIVRERNCLLMQLIGINMIPNIEVNVLSLDDLIINNKTYSKQLDNILNLLKENNAYHFYAGFNNQPNKFESSYSLIHQFVEVLLKL